VFYDVDCGDLIGYNETTRMLADNREFNDWVNGWTTPAPSTYQRSDSLAFQRWFKFKEAFSPSLVKDVIESLPHRPVRILDCFGGSGTTAVVAAMLGIDSTLVEVNPFLADLIEAKLGSYDDFDIPAEALAVLATSEQVFVVVDKLRGRLPPTFLEPGKKERWIFGEEAAIAIEQLRVAIQDVQPPALQRLFRVALGSVLIDASNVRIDGKARRYKTNWKSRRIEATAIRQLFVAVVARMVEDIARFPSKNGDNQILRGDSREVLKSLPAKTIDLAIFSPPYPNSFDYTDIYNVELWMLGYFDVAADNTRLRLQTLRSHVQVKWESPVSLLGSKTLDATLELLRAKASQLWDKRLPEMVFAYFCDLDEIVRGIVRTLNPDGHIAIIVGNSAYAGITVDSSEILKEIAHHHGLIVKKCESVRVMRTSSQQTAGTKELDEWLILLSFGAHCR
jgi:DNA modification methylase